jgi:mono/diheme cytochrome c family protein
MTTANAMLKAANPDAARNPQPSPGSNVRRLGDFPVEVGPAKGAPTPAPEAFAPRPTPAVVMENGKIKQQWQAPAEAANLANPVKDRPNAAQSGRELYLQRCADCHGREGKGNGWLGGNLKRDGAAIVPTNLASKMVQANTDGELFWKITNGRSPMPASGKRFDDEQRWLIVTFLRTLK